MLTNSLQPALLRLKKPSDEAQLLTMVVVGIRRASGAVGQLAQEGLAAVEALNGLHGEAPKFWSPNMPRPARATDTPQQEGK